VLTWVRAGIDAPGSRPWSSTQLECAAAALDGV